MEKEPWPKDIDETTRGHPPESWDGVLDGVDLDARQIPYPDDMPEPQG